VRSEHSNDFNHDAYASTYDAEVADETNPIRAGYQRALGWIRSAAAGCSSILDLGTGTGNVIAVFPADIRWVAVDVSRQMMAVARRKLEGRDVEFVEADLLEYAERPAVRSFDSVVSAYALHHLTDAEKGRLLRRVPDLLGSGGKAAFVDLMYLNERHRDELLSTHMHSRDVVEGIREEFFWDVEETRKALDRDRWTYTITRFSELSWGILLERP
jgi:putative AdoMet-dependent methyltransferase